MPACGSRRATGLRFWTRALVLGALASLDALVGRNGRIGGPGAEPHAYWIPIITIAGGLAGLGFASQTRIVVADRRVLYSAWTTPAVLAALLFGIARLDREAEPVLAS
jgi:hypothetical protein